MRTKQERYIATLLGCAAGDALGMPVEGMKAQQIKKYVGRITGFIDPAIIRDEHGKEKKEDEFGKLKSYPRDFNKGEYTDDTILTLALAEALVAKGFDLKEVAGRQVAEYTQRIRPDGSVLGGFGQTTIDGFKNILSGKSVNESGVIGGPGNAPAMKMSPVGLYLDATGKYEGGLEFAEAVGRITHLDSRSVVSGVVQAHAVYSLLQGTSRGEFLASIVSVSRKYEKAVTKEFPLHDKGSLTSRLEWIADNKNAEDAEAHQVLGSSSIVFQSYPFTLFMFQKYWNEPVDGLIETVNYGGDCDTTGAMYGALAGAKNGMIFPLHWLNELQNRDSIIKLGQDLYKLSEKK
ncbi:ADP-ribosylglycohydrolase family protein [Candidatus Woesearchaeota archaeon]|nr:ADP-ribosylglycohydrolase family protein [Candidatus Woesearchaeota archaeon]